MIVQTVEQLVHRQTVKLYCKSVSFFIEIIWKKSIIVLINIIPVNPLKNKSCVIANADCPVTQEASDRKPLSTIHYCYAARPVLTYLIGSYPAAADKRRYFHVSVVQQQWNCSVRGLEGPGACCLLQCYSRCLGLVGICLVTTVSQTFHDALQLMKLSM